MCGIYGAILWSLNEAEASEASSIMRDIMLRSSERGRDGQGYTIQCGNVSETKYLSNEELNSLLIPAKSGIIKIVGNTRGEPTTEYIQDKKDYDQQPYYLRKGSWHIVHNGTISNDKKIRTFEHPSTIDSTAIVELFSQSGSSDAKHLVRLTGTLEGSYAILASHPETDEIFVACNYKPIWYIQTDYGMFFASSERYFPGVLPARMVQPYTANIFAPNGTKPPGEYNLYSASEASNKKALVVCSGGLDSVVAATYTQKVLGFDIMLLHFIYGSRAEVKEIEAIKSIATYLRVPVWFLNIPIYGVEDSPLLDATKEIAKGEAGAEYAHEWVPARNLVMLSIATATAEAKGFGTIVLGNNLEESGAYPDNEPEFINRFNAMLPFAVGANKRVKVIMPVGNLMKHEIVKLGTEIGAPLHLTWSCYHNGKHHCGDCGPCYMRKKAFKINGIADPVKYLKD